MNQNIELIRGRTEILKVYVVDENGDPYTLADGEKLVFGVKKRAQDENLVVKKAATEGTDGVYQFEIERGETAELAIGKYCYDVGLQSGEDYYTVIPAHDLMLVDGITKHGDCDE